MRRLPFAFACLSLVLACCAAAAANSPVEFFTPTGEVKDVRQVQVRFRESMVPFGDPRELAPFEVACPLPGTGRWADDRNWVYDFAQDLPAGLRCRFTLRSGLATLAGQPLAAGAAWEFTTGGPAIRQSLPGDGHRSIDEQQVFVLGLDAPATRDSITAHAHCAVAGITEAIPVRLVEGEERRQILAGRQQFLTRWYSALLKRAGVAAEVLFGVPEAGSERERFLRLEDAADSPIVVLACARPLPQDTAVSLVWGAGIRAASGIATGAAQTLAFRTRRAFEASFSCERVNRDGGCIPMLPMRLVFTAPVATELAARVRLVPEGGKPLAPSFADTGARAESSEAKAETVSQVTFAGPFPAKTRYRVELPAGLRDDAGRTLVNARAFPLAVATDEHPPLVKFAADFGILEAKAWGDGKARLPVTLRNVEAELAGSALAVPMNPPPGEGGEDPAQTTAVGKAKAWLDRVAGSIAGKAVRVGPGAEIEVIGWLRRLAAARNYGAIGKPMLGAADGGESFRLPEPSGERGSAPGARPFEVVGIPLAPGFHVLEIASPRLGAALRDDGEPYYVQTAALVTNLAVHFKQGRESSLVWVTALDSGVPVPGAAVAVRDCSGKVLWNGITNARGVARVDRALPARQELPGCRNDWDREYFVTARQAADFAFVLSDWNEGIAPWRFNLPDGVTAGGPLLHAVLDRTLLRAGDTVHAKLFYRRPTQRGFALPATPPPAQATIRHQGSDKQYTVAVHWDKTATGTAEFTVPADAELGTYSLDLDVGRDYGDVSAGSFRVEAFRVPTMRAALQAPAAALVGASAVPLDIQIHYLSGGGAADLPVRLRAQLAPRAVSFADYREFTFANGTVAEGRQRQASGGGEDDESGEDSGRRGTAAAALLPTQELVLDGRGGTRAVIAGIPGSDVPRELLAEIEYRDANGETLAAATRVPLWPAPVVLGIKTDSWLASKDVLRFTLLVVDPQGKPQAGAQVAADLLQRQYYSHRRRLLGGFYAYEHGNEVHRLGDACSGVTDRRGMLHCELKPPTSGNLIVRARAVASPSADDGAATGTASHAHIEAWVPGADTWFDVGDNDRIDVIPEKPRFEPGDKARFQVRMPFARATALITVEREGVIDWFVQPLTRDQPVIEVPIKASYAPNVFVSVFVVRGRVDSPAPTAVVDLARPAFRMGIGAIEVGWRAHELKVAVVSDKPVYRVRDKARVSVRVTRADGGKLPANAEIALAAVDEGLLELLPNTSWNLLDAMMRRRGLEVSTATAQMQVVGKRHFGRKAVAAGGGGGQSSARELFDTLLAWRPRVKLDAAGEATIDVPLNDSLTGFRIVAIAHGDAGLFGAGHSSIRSTQPLMVLAGLPPLVREQDEFRALFTVRNASDAPLDAVVSARRGPPGRLAQLPAQTVALAAGEAKEIEWPVEAPAGATALNWEIDAKAGTASDRLKLAQKVVPSLPVRVYQATIAQLGAAPDSPSTPPFVLPIALPADAVPGRGGVRVNLLPRLGEQLAGVREWMAAYPYTCLEQRASQAIALADAARWRVVGDSIAGHLDGDGLAKYFPLMREGSDTLTSYLLAIAAEAGREIPEATRERMIGGLTAFVEGRIVRHSELPTADLAIRKLAAIDALSRYQPDFPERWLDSIEIRPNLWPTSALLDWIDILRRGTQLRERDARLAQALTILRSRLNFQGTTMGFSTERTDTLWWLMISPDVNANRALLTLIDDPQWRADIPRLVRGAVGRQQRGRWNTTVANAWGTLALGKFAAAFEAEPVAGTSRATIANAQHGVDGAPSGHDGAQRGQGTTQREHDWARTPAGAEIDFAWPAAPATLSLAHAGGGRPWAMVQSRAAIPLAAPLSSGYTIRRTLSPVAQKTVGQWTRGDVMRVRLEIEAQSDMTWVVVDDPVPAGATILGSGLGRDSQILAGGERREGWVSPAFEERTFEAFRAYYRFVPKGRWTVEYTARLNNAGEFRLPSTRVEAMYAPEMFGEAPNARLTIR